jgi:NAD-dependent dihydropyrimidine dehydrogenase PreA subunit
MVDVARYFLRFLTEESCGKCTPCREGLKQMLAIYDRLVSGRGEPRDIERIETLAEAIRLGSLCELGRSAVNPVLSTLRYFRAEYDAHVKERACPAGMCRDLTAYEIEATACNGCHVCVAACPAGVISGERKQVHQIDQDQCISCGACYDACRMHAIRFHAKSEKVVADAHAAD